MENYKEKYNEALERARECLQDGTITTIARAYIWEIFPELKGSKDERIREELIEHIKANKYADYVLFKKFSPDDVITWLEKQGPELQYWKPSEKQLEALDYAYNSCPDTERGNYYEGVLETLIDDLHKLSEKQGEQKSTDKTGPKFHEGDWIIHDYNILKIKCVGNTHYCFETVDGYVDDMLVSEIDSQFHLWTIQDAKDGDLIYVSTEIKGIQAIFHKFENGIIYFHCNLCSDFTQGGYEPSGDVKFVSPLHKTHYEKFFQKMKEAGYEWDAEKKELKKVEPKMLDTDEVIEWIDEHVPTKFEDMENYVQQFKKDFKL